MSQISLEQAMETITVSLENILCGVLAAFASGDKQKLIKARAGLGDLDERLLQVSLVDLISIALEQLDIRQAADIEPDSPEHRLLEDIEEARPYASVVTLSCMSKDKLQAEEVERLGSMLEFMGLVSRPVIDRSRVTFFATTDTGRQKLKDFNQQQARARLD